MSERAINDPAAGGWELNPDTGYWMWAAGGGSIQDGDTEGQITTWDGTEWTPESNVVVDANGHVLTAVASASGFLTGAETGAITYNDGKIGLNSKDGPTAYFKRLGSVGPSLIVRDASGSDVFTVQSDGRVDMTGKLFINGQEVTAGGGDSFWVEESPGVIKYTGTAKAADMVSTG